MPYICMATTNIPDGTLQVLDLQPNTSQRNPSIDPPGQTKYVNRAENEPVAVITSGTTGIVNKTAAGLTGYLIEHVEPCGLDNAGGSVTLAAVLANDTVTIAGVVFTAQAGVPNPALQQFQTTAGAGSNNLAADTLMNAINDAASQALITAVLGGGVTISATSPAAAVFLGMSTLGSEKVALATLASSTGVRLAVSGANLALTVGVPTVTQYADAATDILARVDAGFTMTLAAINTILTASLGGADAELDSTGGSRSTGALADVLDILAGRGYAVQAGTVIFTTATTAPVWQENNAAGGFTSSSTVFGQTFANGEWNVKGGTSVGLELKGTRRIVDSTSFRASLLAGQLSQMQGGAVTLFPSSSDNFVSWTFQRNNTASVTGRIVTVYEDDGTLAT